MGQKEARLPHPEEERGLLFCPRLHELAGGQQRGRTAPQAQRGRAALSDHQGHRDQEGSDCGGGSGCCCCGGSSGCCCCCCCCGCCCDCCRTGTGWRGRGARGGGRKDGE